MPTCVQTRSLRMCGNSQRNSPRLKLTWKPTRRTWMADTIDTLPGLQRYAEMIRSNVNVYYEAMVKIFNPTDKMNVLNHGDSWINNVLFKYNDSGKIIDVKLVDLQMCKFCSYAQDIIYFWWSSANENVREHHREELFEVYRQGLNLSLEELGCSDRLSKEVFEQEIKACAPYSVSVISNILTVAMADPDDLLDMSDWKEEEMLKSVGEDAKLTKNYRSKYYKAILPNILRQLESFGAFSCTDNPSDPPWLTDKFLIEVLESVEENKQEVEVLRWSCHPAVPPGTNYLSQLYRVSADYKVGGNSNPQTTSLIIKTPLDSGQVKEFVEMVNGYGREMYMYREVLPKMYQLHSWRLTARTFQCPLENSLALEDLRLQGYKMADRLKQLDIEHCCQFLQSLARFHALSVALNNKEPELLRDVGKELLLSKDPEFRQKAETFLIFSLNAMATTIDSFPGHEHYAEIIRSKVDTFYDWLVERFKPTDNLNVLCHGDPWTNNILFKYDDSGKVIDTKLVDLQMCKICSFTDDLIYFWWTSADENVREHHREELFEVYRQNFNLALEELGCSQRMSKEDFDQEMKTSAPYALSVISNLLTVAMADPNDLLDFSDFDEEDMKTLIIDDNSNHTKNYRSKYYKAVLPNVLRQVEEFGAFM